MTDHSKLKQLAEGCRDEVIRSHGWAGMIEDAGLLSRDELFLKECSPEAVIALIDEIQRLKSVEHAFTEWIEKTEWVQATVQPTELGRHRADVLRARIDNLKTEDERLREDRDGLFEAGAHLL